MCLDTTEHLTMDWQACCVMKSTSRGRMATVNLNKRQDLDLGGVRHAKKWDPA